MTNPPIDPIREQLVMSLVSFIGPRPNLLSPDQTEPVMRLEVSQPILTFEDMEKLRRASTFTQGHFKSEILTMCYAAEWGVDGMEPALAQLCADAEDAVRKGTNIIILTDRDLSAALIPIPALLATAAVHHNLVRAGLRTRCGLVIETGSAREVHHFACLAGFGAEAIHPNLAFATLIDIRDGLPQKVDEKEIVGGGARHALRRQVFQRHAERGRRRGAHANRRGGGAPASPRLLRCAALPRPA